MKRGKGSYGGNESFSDYVDELGQQEPEVEDVYEIPEDIKKEIIRRWEKTSERDNN